MKGKSRILILNDWYEEFDPSTYVEDNLEKTIISRSNIVFPDYYTLPLRKTIEYNGETSQPDLCLIKKDYSDWYVIEIELAEKPFSPHTEKQIRVFSNGRYEASTISHYLYGKNNKLDKTKLEQLIRKELPTVLVMVNYYPKWADELKKYHRTQLLIFNMFDNPNGIEAYRVDGDYPYVEVKRSRCKFPKYPANMLIVAAPAILDAKSGEEVIIYYNGRKSKWERLNSGQKTFLLPKGYNPLNVNKTYFLIKTDKQDLFLKDN